MVWRSARFFLVFLPVAAMFLAACAAFPSAAFAQGPLPDTPTSFSQPTSRLVANPISSKPAGEPFGEHFAQHLAEHHFWDAENIALFAAVAASSGADFAVTRANLQSGGRELNPVVRLFGRSTPGLAVNFCGETMSVIGIGYFLHRTGHHRLERLVSMTNIGISVGSASFSFTHR